MAVLMPQGPVETTADGSKKLTYKWRFADEVANEQDFVDTLRSFASGAVSAASKKAVTGGDMTSGGFFITYKPWDEASVKQQLATEGFAAVYSFQQVWLVVGAPAVNFTFESLKALLKVLAGLGSGLGNSFKYLPWILGLGVLAFGASFGRSTYQDYKSRRSE
jgi:hypothetical protein